VPHCVIAPPTEYSTRYMRLVDELSYTNRCVFCGDVFAAREVGLLSCRFHPMTYYACADRGIPYSMAEASGHCTVCLQYHVPASMRSKITEDQTSRRYDCTRIDHTADATALFEHLVIGVPTFFATKLALYSVSGYKPSGLANVILIDQPEQLTRSVVYNIAGKGVYRQNVKDIYDCMCERFSLDVLDVALSEARKGTKRTATLSSTAGVEEACADERMALYTSDDREVQFVPFYIISRIEQRRNGFRLV